MSSDKRDWVTLEGTHVCLEPLQLSYLDDLCEIGLESTLWEWTTTKVLTRVDMAAYVELALAEREQGTMLPFVTIAKDTGTVVGSTRFGNIDLHNRRLEIGWTWVAPAWQRTAINTEAKLLMLRHAFEVLQCHRVELKTDALNTRSRNAIARLGAIQEGIFRKHMQVDDGRIRDTVYFSIIDTQWPAVESTLMDKLSTPLQPS